MAPSDTDKLDLPYPLGSDPVADGDNAIRALAERLEYLLGGTNTTGAFTFAPNVSNAVEGCAVYASGKLLVCRIAIYCADNFPAMTPLVFVPAGWRPTARSRFVCSEGSGLGHRGTEINTAGELRFYQDVAVGNYWYGTAVYVGA